MKRVVRAITFDFWNTLYSADGGAMDRVRPVRLESLKRLLEAVGATPSEDELARAYRSGFDEYMAAWNRQEHYGAREQVLHILRVFDRAADDDLVLQTATEIEDASLQAPLELLPGVREAIPQLAESGLKLGVISDTSLTPGRLLVRFLEDDGILEHLSALTFSDVTGYTKPDPRMFEQTLSALGVEARDAAHVGDTPRTDIAGARQMGMLSIRCAGAVDHPDPPEADLVIRDHRELMELLDLGECPSTRSGAQ